MGRLGLTAIEMTKQERAILREAREIGADNAQHLGDWEILARLRHHGAATRLIDFTTDPLVAVWFLCDDKTELPVGATVRERTGVLLAMQRDVFGTVSRPYLRNYNNTLTRGAANQLYTTPPIDPRIAAQRGLFAFARKPLTSDGCVESELGLTLPSTDWRREHEDRLARVCDTGKWAKRQGRPIEVFPDILGIEVPALVKPVLLEVLDRSHGFTRASMFPDFAGMGQAYSGRRV